MKEFHAVLYNASYAWRYWGSLGCYDRGFRVPLHRRLGYTLRAAWSALIH